MDNRKNNKYYAQKAIEQIDGLTKTDTYPVLAMMLARLITESY